MINITEGETDSVMTGLDPVLLNINRNQAARVKSADGSAIGKLFFLSQYQPCLIVDFHYL